MLKTTQIVVNKKYLNEVPLEGKLSAQKLSRQVNCLYHAPHGEIEDIKRHH